MNDALRRVIAMCDGGRLPHGLLFVIPGEQASQDHALTAARHILCGTAGGPCLLCSHCRKSAENNHPDLRIVEPEKQEITIDAVRELTRWAMLRPFEAKIKVAVIRPAESLNTAAQSALLRILEEPPRHIVFIAVVRNPDALLPTVVSRLASIRFPSLDETAEPSGPDTPDWWKDLDALAAKPRPVDSAAALALTEAIGRDVEDLTLFFRTVARRLRDELGADPQPAMRRRLDRLFDLSLRLEAHALRGYGNAALAVDRMLLSWLGPGKPPC